jgi:hypothetical protein
MKNKKPICITFAGVVGSSKTPIANFLSCKLNLPVFNNDAIRSEVIEDCGILNGDEHLKRKNDRIKEIIQNKISFICDASIDREWNLLKEGLEKSDYDYFIISLNLSKKLLTNLHKAKGYKESLSRLDQLFTEHETFLQKYGNDVGFTITDENFKNRLEL